MIEVSNLSKSYGKLHAVKDISFTLQKGEILGFLGPNGAGKSTTMNMITGNLLPSSGSIKISDIDIFKSPRGAKKHIGYLPEVPPIYTQMTVNEYLSFICELKDVVKNKSEEINRVCELLDVKDVQKRVIKNLSKGYKQRIGIAQALIGNPDVLILDEPTVGLDPKQIIEIRNIIKSLSEQHTIILSSHILPEVSAICDRIIIMNKGEIKAIDTPENLSIHFTKSIIISMDIEGNNEEITNALSSIPGVISVNSSSLNENIHTYTIESEKNIDIRKPIFFALSEKSFPILRMESKQLSLEDVFLQITLEEDNHVDEQNSEEVRANSTKTEVSTEPTISTEKEGEINENANNM